MRDLTSLHKPQRKVIIMKSNLFDRRVQTVKIFPASYASVGESWEDSEAGEPLELRAIVRVGGSTVAADLPADEQPSSGKISLYFSVAEADRLKDRLIIGCRLEYAGQYYELEDADLLGARPVASFSCKVTARRAAA